MKNFINDDFMLKSENAKKLYHNYAKDMPIYDYHCHLSPKEIAEDKKFRNLTEIWLGGDHYKWRAMRAIGIDEKYITGDASDKEKFDAWIKTLNSCMGNPLYHWSYLELKRYFGIDEIVNDSNKDEIWDKCNKIIDDDKFTVKNIIDKSKVAVICTTDDPLDDLKYHKVIKEDNEFKTKVLPTFRPEVPLNPDSENFISYLGEMERVCELGIKSYDKFLQGLKQRIDYFNSIGCKISDHSFLELPFEETNKDEVEGIFKRAIKGSKLSKLEIDKYVTYTFNALGKMYYEYGWAMQIHIGAIRNNNSKMLKSVGKDSGFDSINDYNLALALNKTLDSLEKSNKLPKTIVYTLNSNNNEVIVTSMGNFQGDGIRGKMQFGAGWWFQDQNRGMLKQMEDLASMGLISNFIGMLTDSRSFLSYTRHEYFRRILCNLVGTWIEEGEVQEDYEVMGKMIQDISYNNASEYFENK